MSVAIISDLHSNIEALTQVLKDIKANNCEHIYCLGDLVGYGPNPAEVVEMCFETKICLLGNHDEGVLKNSYGFNPIARQAIEWTREQLRPRRLFAGARSKKIWNFLRSLPIVYKVDNVLFVHASPRDPVMEYVLRTDCLDLFGRASDKIADIFTRIEWVCFAGHTHDPGIISEEGQFLTPQDMDHRFTFERNKRYIVNVGSVGQPRDGDTRACYAIFDGETVRFRRVEYDYKATMDKIFAIPQLDKKLGERLSVGK
jgi:diadenosine tetraphosphatase ApaH/serine/threonine PP2A family protein phosphatase